MPLSKAALNTPFMGGTREALAEKERPQEPVRLPDPSREITLPDGPAVGRSERESICPRRGAVENVRVLPEAVQAARTNQVNGTGDGGTVLGKKAATEKQWRRRARAQQGKRPIAGSDVELRRRSRWHNRDRAGTSPAATQAQQESKTSDR